MATPFAAAEAIPATTSGVFRGTKSSNSAESTTNLPTRLRNAGADLDLLRLQSYGFWIEALIDQPWNMLRCHWVDARGTSEALETQRSGNAFTSQGSPRAVPRQAAAARVL